MTKDTTPCSCGSESLLTDCCLPYIRGGKAPSTAEQLLRARYTAFTLGEVNYVLETHHSRTKNEVKRNEIEQWAKESHWLGLKIVQKEGGSEKDTQGTIVFCATYESKDRKHEHWEQSFFEKENGQWKFLDAKAVHTGPFHRTEPKVGRNDPCTCGSGKKFKKCCGSAVIV